MQEYEVVAESDGRRVAVYGKLKKEFQKARPKDRANLIRWMENWCKDATSNALPAERFKKQEAFRDAKGRSVSIYAFKAYQARAYGFSRVIEGKETFLVGSIDPDKKSDEANQSLIQKARDEAFRILEIFNIR